MVVSTRTHVHVGFANPFLICTTCGAGVPYWHDPERCGCNTEMYNYPCGHPGDIVSTCPTWSPVDSCKCKKKHSK